MNLSSLLDKSPLVDRTILVTRPQKRAGQLLGMIKHAGGTAIHYPAINIEPPADLDVAALQKLREQLHSFNMAVFISATAVEQSLVYFPVLPDHLDVVSIGNKTSEALARHNIHVDIEAPDKDTESLLALARFQMPLIEGERVLVFRGVGGRQLLGDTLVRRGAQVRYVETYQRCLPQQGPLTPEVIAGLDAITISSNEGLDNLVSLMEDPSGLIKIPVFVPSARAARLARQHGFHTIVQTANATDEAMLTGLADFFNDKNRI